MWQRPAEALAGGRLPELGFPSPREDVAAACQQVAAVGAENYRPNGLAMIERRDRGFPGDRVPQPGAVLGSGPDEAAIRAKCEKKGFPHSAERRATATS